MVLEISSIMIYDVERSKQTLKHYVIISFIAWAEQTITT